jgi:hypothetical protein
MDSNPFPMTIDVPAESRGGVLCVRLSGDVDLSNNWDRPSEMARRVIARIVVAGTDQHAS